MTNLGQKLLEQVAGNIYLSFIGINVRGGKKTNKQTNKQTKYQQQTGKKKKKTTPEQSMVPEEPEEWENKSIYTS